MNTNPALPTDKQLQQERQLLSRLLPFEVWERNLSDERRAQVERLWGSPEKFYETFESQLRTLAEDRDA